MSRNYDNFADLITFSRASRGTSVRHVRYGDELVTNGTFDTDVSGWTGVNAILSTSSGGMAIADNGIFSVAYQAISTVAGKQYTISVDVVAVSGPLSFNFGNSSVAPSGSFYAENQTTISSAALGVYMHTFTASGNTTYVSFGSDGASTVTVDNVSVKQVTLDDPDDPLLIYNHFDDEPRIDFDAVTGDRKGLLIEEARTNEITYSEDFSESIWGSSNVVLTSSQSSPDGTLSATKLADDASTGSGPVNVAENGFRLDADTSYTWSVFAKADQSDFAVLIVSGYASPSGSNRAWFNLSTGTVGTSDSDFTSSITDFGNGWYRIAVTFTPSGGDLVGNLGIRLSNADGVTDVTLDGSNSIFIYGAQLEEGSFPTSYIPTSGSTVTRSADVASIATSAFGYNSTEGTLFTEDQAIHDTGGTVNYAVCALFEDNDNFVHMHYRFASGRVQIETEGTAVIVATGDGDLGNPNKRALGFDTSSAIHAYNGTLATDTSTGLPSPLSTMTIGSFGNPSFPNYFNGHIKKLQYFPRRLSDTELQEITS